MEKVYRYMSKGEGIFSAGKRLLPDELLAEANKNRAWLPKPSLSEGEYIFYLTEKGKKQYENSLFHVHQKYLENITCEEVTIETNDVIYRDEWQIVVKK